MVFNLFSVWDMEDKIKGGKPKGKEVLVGFIREISVLSITSFKRTASLFTLTWYESTVDKKDSFVELNVLFIFTKRWTCAK